MYQTTEFDYRYPWFVRLKSFLPSAQWSVDLFDFGLFLYSELKLNFIQQEVWKLRAPCPKGHLAAKTCLIPTAAWITWWDNIWGKGKGRCQHRPLPAWVSQDRSPTRSWGWRTLSLRLPQETRMLLTKASTVRRIDIGSLTTIGMHILYISLIACWLGHR